MLIADLVKDNLDLSFVCSENRMADSSKYHSAEVLSLSLYNFKMHDDLHEMKEHMRPNENSAVNS